jgi:L-Ala-D/L-Glu epimerase
MFVTCSRFLLTKRYPLTISRGTITGSTNVLVTVEHDGVQGIGEMAPSDVTGDSAEHSERTVATWADTLANVGPFERQRINELLGPVPRIGSAIRAALDMALLDWFGNATGRPAWQIVGSDPSRCVPTSLTVGINPPNVVEERTYEILMRTGAQVLKVKLGQPSGIDDDKAMFEAAQRGARRAALETGIEPAWRVDANGGWNLDGAQSMIPWLADKGATYVEQPLAEADYDDLPRLFRSSELPIYADESIHSSNDVASHADRVHGVNLKIMKCGGIGPAMEIIHTARAHGLSVMIGCMGESSLAISAGAAIGGFCDHLDLDSHLNLIDDPFHGAHFENGRVFPNDRPGLGVTRKNTENNE